MPLGRNEGVREMDGNDINWPLKYKTWKNFKYKTNFKEDLGEIVTIHGKYFRELQKELLLETNIHSIRIVAKLKLCHMKHGELFSLNRESMQELSALGTKLHRQTGVSFCLCWVHLPHTIMTFRRSIRIFYLSFIFVCVQIFRVFLNLALENVLSKLYTFIDVF